MKRILHGILGLLSLAMAPPAHADQSGGCLPTTGTYTGLTAAGYINSGFTSIFTANSGASAPANPCGGNPVKGQFWLNTSSGTLQPLSVYDGTQWLTVGTLDLTGHKWQFPPFPTQLQAADGTLSLPGISFATDPNTGIYRTGDGGFDLVSNGVSQLQVTTGGVNIPAFSGLAQGQVRLVKTGANLQLLPYNGNQLTIGGANRTVPLSGPTLAPGGLSVGQTYYIYAFMTGSVMGIEASTTGHSADSTGLHIKTGDASRTLVGMALTNTGPAWTDAPTARWVASWFNRRPRSLNFPLAGSATVSQTSASQFPIGWTVYFLSWGTDAVPITITSNWDVPDLYSMFTSPWVDGGVGTATYGYHTLYCACSGNFFAIDTHTFSVEFAEGNHSVSLATWVNGGNATFILNGVISGTVYQ